MTTNDHAWLTIAEAARELRVSVPTIRRWIRAGRLAAARVGARSLRIQRSALTDVRHEATRQPDVDAAPNGAGFGSAASTAPDFEEVMRRMKELRERILVRRGGVPLPDSSDAIREAREERYADL